MSVGGLSPGNAAGRIAGAGCRTARSRSGIAAMMSAMQKTAVPMSHRLFRNSSSRSRCPTASWIRPRPSLAPGAFSRLAGADRCADPAVAGERIPHPPFVAIPAFRYGKCRLAACSCRSSRCLSEPCGALSMGASLADAECRRSNQAGVIIGPRLNRVGERETAPTPNDPQARPVRTRTAARP